MMLAKMVPSLWTDITVLVTLLILLLASAGTFWALVRRWESHRQWMAIADWGKEHGYRSHPLDPAHLPPPLDRLSDRDPLVRLSMADGNTLLVQMQTAPAQQPGNPQRLGGEVVWNLLIRRLNSAWEPTGLRPSSPLPSVLDLFSLSSFPLLGTTERFTIFGTDTDAAEALSASMTRSLLPPDIGLLLHGNQLVLDFSQRPFDEIEFNRMIALIDQVAQKLPPRNVRAIHGVDRFAAAVHTSQHHETDSSSYRGRVPSRLGASGAGRGQARRRADTTGRSLAP